MKKVGILGGTFNPPHNGHLHIAESLLDEFSLDEIIMLPSGQPPHKRDQQIASNEHRLEMLKRLAAHNPKLTVSTQEFERSGFTYTVDTLTDLHKNVTDSEFYYIIGTDTLFKLTEWMRFEEVLKLTRFLCVPRPGDDLGKAEKQIALLAQQYDANIHLTVSMGPDISSTQIRECTAQGSPLTGLVPEKVEEYIKEHGLFR